MIRPIIKFNYLNHRGEVSERKVGVIGVEFNYNPNYGYQPGWFLRGFDLDKQAERSFALNRVQLPETPEVLGRATLFTLFTS
jgi:predicted DNA-binding transcriptional regulator YafY